MVIDVLGGLLKATANHFHITEKIIIFLFHHLQREVGKFHIEVDKNDGKLPTFLLSPSINGGEIEYSLYYYNSFVYFS